MSHYYSLQSTNSERPRILLLLEESIAVYLQLTNQDSNLFYYIYFRLFQKYRLTC